MPGTITPHEALDSCHRFCFASTAYTEVVIRAEKWPYGAACCSAVLCVTQIVPSSRMGNLPSKQMDESENRMEIRIGHRNISV